MVVWGDQFPIISNFYDRRVRVLVLRTSARKHHSRPKQQCLFPYLANPPL